MNKDTTKSKIEFIKRYLGNHGTASVVDKRFHDEWYKKFGGKRTIYAIGASPCPNAMVYLKRLYDQGILARRRIGIHCKESGFPNWCYVYEISTS